MSNQKHNCTEPQIKKNKEKIFNQEVIKSNKKKCKFVSKIVNKVVKVTNKEYTLRNLKHCVTRNFQNMRDKIEKCDLNSSVASAASIRSTKRPSTSSYISKSSKRSKKSASIEKESLNHNISTALSKSDRTSSSTMSPVSEGNIDNKLNVSGVQPLFDIPIHSSKKAKEITENISDESNLTGVKSLFTTSPCSSKKGRKRSEYEEDTTDKLNLTGVKSLFSTPCSSKKGRKRSESEEDTTYKLNLTGVKSLSTTPCSSKKGRKRSEYEEYTTDKLNLTGVKSLFDTSTCSSNSSRKRRNFQKEIKSDVLDSERSKLIRNLVNEEKKRLSLPAKTAADDADTDLPDLEPCSRVKMREKRGQDILNRIKKLRELPDYEKIDKILNAPPLTYYQKSLKCSLNTLPVESKTVQHWNKYSFLCRKIEQSVLHRQWNNMTKLLIVLADAPTRYKPFLLKASVINILCNPAIDDYKSMLEQFLKSCYSCQSEKDICKVLTNLFHINAGGEEDDNDGEIDNNDGKNDDNDEEEEIAKGASYLFLHLFLLFSTVITTYKYIYICIYF